MSTKKWKQSNNGNNSTTKDDSTQPSESKFSGESQSSLNSSESGQSYMSVDYTPFAIIKRREKFVIILAADIISTREFDTFEEAEEYIEGKPWELLWATTMWVMTHAEEIKEKITIKK